MARDDFLNDAVLRISRALVDFATEAGIDRNAFRVFVRINRKWGKFHILVVSDYFNGRTSAESYVMVRRFLEESFKDAPEILLAMGLIVRSSVQTHSGGIYGIGSEYHEIDLESPSAHV